MSQALIALGGNQGAAPLWAALQALQQLGALRCSPVYASAAGEGQGCADYLNLVVELETALSHPQLTQRLQAIEDAGGRRRDLPGVCHVDLDLLICAGQVLRPTDLERAYMALPWAHLRGQPRPVASGHLWPGEAMAVLAALQQRRD